MLERTDSKVRSVFSAVSLGGETRNGWFSIVRIVFAGYLLIFPSLRSAAPVADLPDTYINPPLGPFMLISSAPSELLVTAFEVGATLGLVLLLVGYRTAAVSYILPGIFVVLAGIRFSTGKIDHDILVYLVPLFLARAWGSRLSVRPEKYVRHHLDVLALCLGFFFLSSGILKASTGWLDWDYSATSDWLAFYQTNYGVQTSFAARLDGFPAPVMELLDWMTVLLECSILPLLLFKRSVAAALLMCLIFNIAVFLLFGINFAQLFPLYFALLPLTVKTPERINWLVAGSLLLVTTVFANLNSLSHGVVTLGPVGDSVSIFWVLAVLLGSLMALTVFLSVREERGYNVSLKSSLVVIAVLSVPLLLTIFWTEPFPAIIGPGFRAGVTGELKQVWMKDGVEVQSSEVFGGSPYSQNIGFYGWPSPEGQGHEFLPWNSQRVPELPDGVTVEWIRVR